MALNLPITISTYVQERPVFKNRRQRRAKVVRPDFTPVSWGGRIAGQAVDAPTALPTLPSFPSPVEEGVDALRLADSSLTQAILLDWLGQQPIAFHRIYVDISGSVTAAVWLSLVLSRMSGISSEQIGATGFAPLPHHHIARFIFTCWHRLMRQVWNSADDNIPLR